MMRRARRRFVDAVNETEKRNELAVHCILKGPAGVRADLHGLALSVSSGRSAFAAVQGAQSLPSPFVELLKSPTWIKAAHDLKPTLLAMTRAGLALDPPWFDTMIAAYLLNPNRRTHTLESVALDVLGYHLWARQGQRKQRKLRRICSTYPIHQRLEKPPKRRRSLLDSCRS